MELWGFGKAIVTLRAAKGVCHSAFYCQIQVISATSVQDVKALYNFKYTLEKHIKIKDTDSDPIGMMCKTVCTVKGIFMALPWSLLT